jgi:hypothetical protein
LAENVEDMLSDNDSDSGADDGDNGDEADAGFIDDSDWADIYDELEIDLGIEPAQMDDSERMTRATISDEPPEKLPAPQDAYIARQIVRPEGLPAPPDAYINQTEYQDICADIRERMPSNKRRRNELRLMEPVTANKPDAEVIARLAFWERVRRDDDNLYNLRRLTNGMSAKELRQNLVNKFSCDRKMLRSSTHKGDANKEELQLTYMLFARAAANPDATPNTMPR